MKHFLGGAYSAPANPPAVRELANGSSCRSLRERKNSLREFLFSLVTQIFLISTSVALIQVVIDGFYRSETQRKTCLESDRNLYRGKTTFIYFL